ncbi:MAG: mechanosensitive ion channel family protein [Synergistes sp.]|nr:mechanosensitive ion channel family protein [Synergistes sp.]
MDFSLTQLISKVTLSKLIPAFAYLAVGLILRMLLMRLVRKMLEKANVKESLSHLVLGIISVLAYIVIFMAVAAVFGIQTTSVVALLSVAGLAVSLSVQGILTNCTGCAVLLTVHPFRIGDYIEADGIGGVVKYINLIYTTFVTYDNKVIYVPNSHLMSAKIINYSGDGRRRVDFVFKAGYDVPVNTVKGAIQEAIDRFPNIHKDPAPYIRISEYGDSTISYTVRVWCDTVNYWAVHDDILEAVGETFAAHNIDHIYPQRDLRILKD